MVALFCNLALGGMALGIGFGIATSLWLSRVYRDPIIMTVITFLRLGGGLRGQQGQGQGRAPPPTKPTALHLVSPNTLPPRTR